MTIEQHSINHDISVANAMAATRTQTKTGSKRKVTIKDTKPITLPTSKTGRMLLHRAANNAAQFTGKFFFGATKRLSAVLPPALPPLPTHRDAIYLKGEPLPLYTAGY